MAHFIKSVADLTSRDDRDELELALASVTAKLLSASKLRLWRIASYSGELRLRVRICLKNYRAVAIDPQSEVSELPLLNSNPDLRACYDSNAPAPLGAAGPVSMVTSSPSPASEASSAFWKSTIPSRWLRISAKCCRAC